MIKFLSNIGEFADFHISEEEKGCYYAEESQKLNPDPRKVVSLERAFDREDGHKPKEESSTKPSDYIEVNIGTKEEPRMVKIGKSTPKDEKEQIINLLREYRDVLAFTYDELKVYREDVIQHTIPLKEEAKPFRQKLRQINPKLAPLVQQELQKMLKAGIIAHTRHSA